MAGRRAFSGLDRKSTRLNSSHSSISYAVFCLKKKKKKNKVHQLKKKINNKKEKNNKKKHKIIFFLYFLIFIFLKMILIYYFLFFFFFFNDTATTEIYTLSLHDALPIRRPISRPSRSMRSVVGRPS